MRGLNAEERKAERNRRLNAAIQMRSSGVIKRHFEIAFSGQFKVGRVTSMRYWDLATAHLVRHSTQDPHEIYAGVYYQYCRLLQESIDQGSKHRGKVTREAIASQKLRLEILEAISRLTGINRPQAIQFSLGETTRKEVLDFVQKTTGLDIPEIGRCAPELVHPSNGNGNGKHQNGNGRIPPG